MRAPSVISLGPTGCAFVLCFTLERINLRTESARVWMLAGVGVSICPPRFRLGRIMALSRIAG